MKKIILAIAIIITLGLTANAQRATDGFFNNFHDDNYNREIGENGDITLIVPNHGYSGYAQGDGSEVPIGTGFLILTALGAGYAVARKKK